MSKTAENAVNVVISLECASQRSGKLKPGKKRVELSSYVENKENNKITIRVKAGQSLSVHMQVDGVRLPMEMNAGASVSTVNMAEMF